MRNNDFKILEDEIKEIMQTNQNYKDVIIEMFNNSNQLKKDKIALVSKNISASWMVDTLINAAKENPNDSTWILFAIIGLKSEHTFVDIIHIAMAGDQAVKMMADEIIGQMTYISRLNKENVSELCASYKREKCNTEEEISFINNCIYVANTLPVDAPRKTATILQFPTKIKK